MEKTASKKRAKTVSEDKLQELYIHSVLMHGKKPASIYAFCKEAGINESDFFSKFNSFGALEREIWNNWMKSVMATLEADKAFADYSVREKLLAFYFTWIEMLKENRSYVLMNFEHLSEKDVNPPFLQSLKHTHKEFIEDMMMEGKDTMEVAERPFSNLYDKGFWLQFLFLTKFWVRDDSKDYEQTDAAIEKSVNFMFDLIAAGPLDSFLDLAKFLYHSRKPF